MAKQIKQEGEPADQEEGNRFDKIIKEDIEILGPCLVRKVVGHKDARLESLPQVRVQTTKEREPDYAVKLFDGITPGGRLFQAEFEGKDDKDTDARMYEYHATEFRKYGLDTEQHLFFLLKGKPKNIKAELHFLHHSYRYKVHLVHEISHRLFLTSDEPAEVVWAILADPEDVPPEELVRLILERLVQLRGNSLETRKFVRKLEMFSLLRNLQPVTEKLSNQMNFIIPTELLEQDRLYKKGKVEGEARGEARGEAKGEEKKALVGIRNMVAKGFEPVVIADLLDVAAEFVLHAKKQLEQEPKIKALLLEGKLGREQVARRLKVSPLLVEIIRDDLPKPVSPGKQA